MPLLTLDTNCLLDVKEANPGHESVVSLVGLHRRGLLTLRLVAVSATDLLDGHQKVETLDDFRKWVAELGFGGLEVLLPLGVYGYVFLDGAVIASEDDAKLYEDIGRVLFPNAYPSTADHPPKRSQICDTLLLWSHIHNGGEIFVTRDKNFTKATKTPKLIHLGAGRIMNAVEAAVLFSPPPA